MGAAPLGPGPDAPGLLAMLPDWVVVECVGLPPQPFQEIGNAVAGPQHVQLVVPSALPEELGRMLVAHLRIERMTLAQERGAQAGEVPGGVPLAEGVAVRGAERRPGAIAVGEMHADARLETPVRPFDDDVDERRCVSPILAEGPPEQGPQNLADTVHQPPCSCGMNRVCSTCGSNLRSSLPGPPSRPRATARKPLPVSSRNRSSARVTVLESALSNSCRVSPVRSITIWTAMSLRSLLTHQGGRLLQPTRTANGTHGIVLTGDVLTAMPSAGRGFTKMRATGSAGGRTRVGRPRAGRRVGAASPPRRNGRQSERPPAGRLPSSRAARSWPACPSH